MTGELLHWRVVDTTPPGGHEARMTFKNLLNGALFQLAWLGAILAAARGWAWIAALPPLAVVAFHLWQVEDRGLALRLIGVSACAGIVGDAVVMAIAKSTFSAHAPLTWLPPAWTVALWMGFATLPNMALRWFRDHLVLVAVLAAVFGPFTYNAGAELGAGSMGSPLWLNLVALGLLWAIVAPGLLWLARAWETERTAIRT